MDGATQALISTLDELVSVLESDGAMRWSSWMQDSATLLRNGDAAGAEHFLRAFGGMGSLNDLILGQTTSNGTFAWKSGHVELNERFEMLRTKAWELARQIQRGRRARHFPRGRRGQA